MDLADLDGDGHGDLFDLATVLADWTRVYYDGQLMAESG